MRVPGNMNHRQKNFTNRGAGGGNSGGEPQERRLRVAGDTPPTTPCMRAERWGVATTSFEGVVKLRTGS